MPLDIASYYAFWADVYVKDAHGRVGSNTVHRKKYIPKKVSLTLTRLELATLE